MVFLLPFLFDFLQFRMTVSDGITISISFQVEFTESLTTDVRSVRCYIVLSLLSWSMLLSLSYHYYYCYYYYYYYYYYCLPFIMFFQITSTYSSRSGRLCSCQNPDNVMTSQTLADGCLITNIWNDLRLPTPVAFRLNFKRCPGGSRGSP